MAMYTGSIHVPYAFKFQDRRCIPGKVLAPIPLKQFCTAQCVDEQQVHASCTLHKHNDSHLRINISSSQWRTGASQWRTGTYTTLQLQTSAKAAPIGVLMGASLQDSSQTISNCRRACKPVAAGNTKELAQHSLVRNSCCVTQLCTLLAQYAAVPPMKRVC